MATRALTAPADGKRPAPLVTVMVDFDTFTGRVCELAAGTVIAPGAVAELLGHDETLIQRVVADGPNRVRDISSARTSGAPCAASSTSCTGAATTRPASSPPTSAKATTSSPGSNGGLTTQDNGRLGCGPHNRWWYTTGQSHPPPHHPDDPDALLDDDELDDDAARPGPDGRATPKTPLHAPHRPRAPHPTLQVGDGDERCTIDLHPLGHTTDRWRDYPIRYAA